MVTCSLGQSTGVILQFQYRKLLSAFQIMAILTLSVFYLLTVRSPNWR